MEFMKKHLKNGRKGSIARNLFVDAVERPQSFSSDVLRTTLRNPYVFCSLALTAPAQTLDRRAYGR